MIDLKNAHKMHSNHGHYMENISRDDFEELIAIAIFAKEMVHSYHKMTSWHFFALKRHLDKLEGKQVEKALESDEEAYKYQWTKEIESL